MSKIDNESLTKTSKILAAGQRVSVIKELQDYTGQLRALKGTFYGSSGIRDARISSLLTFHSNTRISNMALTLLDSSTTTV
jgi:hypothetical protein